MDNSPLKSPFKFSFASNGASKPNVGMDGELNATIETNGQFKGVHAEGDELKSSELKSEGENAIEDVSAEGGGESPDAKSCEETANLRTNVKTSKKKDITLNLGSKRGKVKVMLGKLHKKNKPWKPSIEKKCGDNPDSNLLGNLSVSGWGEDEENNSKDAKQKVTLQKEKKLRRNVFEETKRKDKDKKRKMYLDKWDAGLDAGRVKKVKGPKIEEQYPKENPFHHIQQSLLQMSHKKPKGRQVTSMKKRRRLK
mmetsp:Transcript_4908/g.7395  ORF Transcript_4908/g.7395 Transcript_4908/m.7395 type:complete len:253 (+) Transcript_4908:220-978(+)